ncbi:hypothetical protein AX774_g5442 [Zancudomyces culisetae]|uniref:Uncharacterized protein n=1 Tax=Zancudomyces culisetae TaxID=1213189 RepID=A0A1R1PJL3_ZANCU|nr:hypothetical protein AX774_g5442 [Zancudomyces culisetae]|eukprot:OMH81113.1 hypothetical protein AX774_g5442 [Zancudomyces culisetae]
MKFSIEDSKWTCKNNLLESKLEWKKKFEGQYEWVEVQNFVTRNLIHLKPENPDYPVPGTSMFGVASAFMEKDRISEGCR